MREAKRVIEKHQLESLDLLDFLSVLGKGAWLILLCAALFGAIVFATTYLFKQEWKAEAYIDPPTTAELGNYYALSSMYALISGTPVNQSEAKDGMMDNGVLILHRVYGEIKRQLSADNTIRQFWLNTDYYKQQVTGDSKKDTELLERLIKHTKFVEANAAKKLPDRISMQLDNPKLTPELLAGFMNFTNLITREILYKDLVVKWQTLFNQTSAAAQVNLGKIKQGDKIEEQDWQGKLKLMQSVKPLDNQFVSFRYIKPPLLLAKTYPDRMLWASMAAAFGLLFGCAVVLSLNLRERKRELAGRE